MTTEHDKAVLNAMFNPNTPFAAEEEKSNDVTNQNSKCKFFFFKFKLHF